MQESIQEKNEKTKNINSQNKEEDILKNDNLNNNNVNESSDFEKEDQPFFIMTLEFEKGKYKKIKIYPDSDPTELAD